MGHREPVQTDEREVSDGEDSIAVLEETEESARAHSTGNEHQQQNVCRNDRGFRRDDNTLRTLRDIHCVLPPQKPHEQSFRIHFVPLGACPFIPASDETRKSAPTITTSKAGNQAFRARRSGNGCFLVPPLRTDVMARCKVVHIPQK